MTSKTYHDHEAYVWVWLPNALTPVVAGRLLQSREGHITFNYGKSYLSRSDAIAIYSPELPLRSGVIETKNPTELPSCIRDASPDAWGRRVIINRLTGLRGSEADQTSLSELTYLLESGSDRLGMLDFQASSSAYKPRYHQNATLDELVQSAECLEQGGNLPSNLDQALLHGSSIGGARPKTLIDQETKKYIAKFSSNQDIFNVVKAEYVAMRLAQEIGMKVSPVKLSRALGKDVLLIERFDRIFENNGWYRRGIVSVLTLLGLDEMEARYASYEDLATLVRHRFDHPHHALQELFSRMVFNILCGNTDDHARNHAAFWDGRSLSLTPAYDLCPQNRTGGEASQAMCIIENKRLSRLSLCLEAAPYFHLDVGHAWGVIKRQISIIQSRWHEICDEACLSDAERAFLWRRQILNPSILYGLSDQMSCQIKL